MMPLRRTRGRKPITSSLLAKLPSFSVRPQRTKARVAQQQSGIKASPSSRRVALKKPKIEQSAAELKHESEDLEDDLNEQQWEEYVESFCCIKCNETFESLASLENHAKEHAFVCKYCPASFRLRKLQKEHMDRVHSSVPRFVCSECESVFKCRQSLREHLVRKHTEGFRFACASCDKKFKMKSDLYMHVQSIHGSSESQAVCDVCGKTYRNAFALKKHLAHAHNQRPFSCQICKRKLATRESLEQHAKLHLRKERVICQLCGKTFSGNDALKKHTRIHTGQRPFPCKICGKTFRRQNTHKQHLLTHSGVKPYVCDVCGKAFTQKPGLITHRKKHPGPLPPLPAISIDYVIADLIDKTDNKTEQTVHEV